MNTKKRIVILILLMLIDLSILLIPVYAVPLSDYHGKPIICQYCHEVRGFSVGTYEGENEMCDNCHNIADNINSLEAAHSKVCNRCHTIPTNPQEYHQLHTPIACTRCHGNGTQPIRPTVGITNCVGCHGVSASLSGNVKIHDVHKSIIDKACPTCHGTRPSSSPSLSSSLSSPAILVVQESKKNIVSTIYAKTIDYKQYTLYEVFKKLISLF